MRDAVVMANDETSRELTLTDVRASEPEPLGPHTYQYTHEGRY